jgi:hypothetical protein
MENPYLLWSYRSSFVGYMGSRSEESHWFIAVAFIIGAFFSALAGYIGMRAATKANVRTAHAARTSLIKSPECFFYRRCRYGNGCCRIGGAWV